MARIDFNQEFNVIIVDVEIKDSDKTVRTKMALDTGATYVMITWEIAQSLGLRPELSNETIEIITASGVEKVPAVILRSITVAGKEARDIKAVVHDLPPKSYIDGLLGLSFLRNFNVHLNFKANNLEID